MTLLLSSSTNFRSPAFLNHPSMFEEKFPTFKITREGKSSTWSEPRRIPSESRRRLKYDRDHMAKAQKLTSLKRT